MGNKLIPCKTCGQEMSSGAKLCPRCGEPNGKHEGPITKLIKFCLYILFGLFALGALLSMCMNSDYQSTSSSSTYNAPASEPMLTGDEGKALSECKYQIAKHLGVPGHSGSLPDSKNFSSKGEFQFSWPRGTFSLTSPLGDATPSASCGGKLMPLKVDWITINGNDYKPFKIQK